MDRAGRNQYGQSREEHQATTSDRPCPKLLVFDDFSVTSKCCRQTKLGENVMQSVVRSNLQVEPKLPPDM